MLSRKATAVEAVIGDEDLKIMLEADVLAKVDRWTGDEGVVEDAADFSNVEAAAGADCTLIFVFCAADGAGAGDDGRAGSDGAEAWPEDVLAWVDESRGGGDDGKTEHRKGCGAETDDAKFFSEVGKASLDDKRGAEGNGSGTGTGLREIGGRAGALVDGERADAVVGKSRAGVADVAGRARVVDDAGRAGAIDVAG